MISVTNDYKRQLIAGNRNWKIKVPVYLADNATSTPDFTLTNQEIWEHGICVDDATSSDDSFDLGAAIIGSLKVIINNINGHYSTYDFFNAKLVLWLGVEGDVDEHDEQVFYRIGFYNVDTPSYNGSLITLNCLDNMTWFDAPFSDVTGITYPTTAGQLVATVCSHVGVTLGTVTFPNYTTQIPFAPEGELNCREVLQYVAQMCCCYCKINTAGELALAWYDKNAIIGLTDYDGGTYNTNTTPYSDGDDVDGGHFNPWDGDNADGGTFQDLMNGAYLTQNYQMEVSTDDIVVTGCRVVNTASDDSAYDELWVDSTLEQDHERYVLVIENNPFIDTTNAATIANQVGSILAGLPIRAFSATSLADFSYETGDMVTIYDFRGNFYRTWITHFVFTTNNSEQFSCGAQSVKQKSETRFSTPAQTLDKAAVMLSNYDKAVQALNDLGQEALSYNVYRYETGGGVLTWLYNGSNVDDTDPDDPLFVGSTVVIKITGDGVFISNTVDPITGEPTYEQGYDANSGTAILNMIFAHGITADWIRAGTLTLGGYDNKNGLCSVLDALGVEKVRLDNSGLKASAGSIDGTLTIGASGYIGSSAGNMNGLKIGNGTLGISTGIGGSWCELAFGQEAAEKSGWNKACCIIWNGGNGDGGFNVVSGSPNEGNTGNLSTLKQSALQFWVSYNLAYYYDTGGGHSGSDERLKYDVKPFDVKDIRRFFDAVNPVSFKYKYNDSKQFGIISQELDVALKEANLENDVIIEETPTEEKYQSVAYSEFHGLELAGIKDLYEIVKKQQAEIDLLKAEIAELKETRKE